MNAPEPTGTTWRTSSYSGSNGNCVQVALGPAVAVRDSKNTTGPTLSFNASAWRAFTVGAASATE